MPPHFPSQSPEGWGGAHTSLGLARVVLGFRAVGPWVPVKGCGLDLLHFPPCSACLPAESPS